MSEDQEYKYFRKKLYPEIFMDGLENALKEGLISHEEEFASYIQNKEDIENFYVLLLSVHAEWIEAIYEAMQSIYDSTFIDTAHGLDLDKIGAILGVQRAAASYAYVDIVLSLSHGLDEDVTLEKGLQCITNSGVGYHTIADVYIPAGTTGVTVPAKADKPGPAYRIFAHELQKVTTSPGIKATLSCDNPESSSGGKQVQMDSEYREYLKNWYLIHQKGNDWAYKYFFRNFDGLDGYNVTGCWDGTGTVKVVIDPPSDYLRNEIYEELTETRVDDTGEITKESVCLFDEDVVVMGYQGKTIDVNATINVDIDVTQPYSNQEKEIILNKIRGATQVFIDGGYINDYYRDENDNRMQIYYPGLGIGEDFIYHKLAAFLDKEIPELKNITFNYPIDTENSTSDEIVYMTYIPISNDEKAVAGDIDVSSL